ncbi:Cinnamoyl-CoA reductase 1 [Zea mays]|uniref:Cinnamoyl-CoA reductase 1 n=1 Tax=Zea mays TaxID=4577 RepID=A0A3L6DBP6_MAIZE|nr:Cinnamoyl-CoA reductase 1 [Zea mays]
MAAAAKSVCVTGAGGFIASWLVKLLLSRGQYVVRGTVRDPDSICDFFLDRRYHGPLISDFNLDLIGQGANGSQHQENVLSKPIYLVCALGASKNAHLKELERAGERLQLLQADLLDYSSVASAIAGCEGVFHVACPVPSGRSSNPEVEVIGPAVVGTTNVLKACYEAKVKRVVVVSSVSAVFSNPNWPKDKVFDEDSWSDEDYCRKNEVMQLSLSKAMMLLVQITT